MNDTDHCCLRIPSVYVPGASVDLIYLQALDALGSLARQQLAAGASRLFEIVPALKAFVVVMEFENEQYLIGIEHIEVMADASDDVKVSDLKNAILEFAQTSVPAVLYQQVSGQRFERDKELPIEERTSAESDNVTSTTIEHREQEVAVGIGHYVIGVPDAHAELHYVRVTDMEQNREYVVDAAFLRAQPELAIKVLADIASAASSWKEAA